MEDERREKRRMGEELRKVPHVLYHYKRIWYGLLHELLVHVPRFSDLLVRFQIISISWFSSRRGKREEGRGR